MSIRKLLKHELIEYHRKNSTLYSKNINLTKETEIRQVLSEICSQYWRQLIVNFIWSWWNLFKLFYKQSLSTKKLLVGLKGSWAIFMILDLPLLGFLEQILSARLRFSYCRFCNYSTLQQYPEQFRIRD